MGGFWEIALSVNTFDSDKTSEHLSGIPRGRMYRRNDFGIGVSIKERKRSTKIPKRASEVGKRGPVRKSDGKQNVVRK